MSRMLVVDDSQLYRDACAAFLKGMGYAEGSMDRGFVMAPDYKTAVGFTERYKPTCAFFDCFFPAQTGSGDISLGEKALQMMKDADPGETRVRAILAEFAKYVDMGKAGVLARRFARTEKGDEEPCKITVIASLARANKFLGMDGATRMAMTSLGATFGSEDGLEEGPYDALEAAMRKSPDNQPLCVLLGEEAAKRKMPFVLVTSTNHHDKLTQPIFDYARRRNWRLDSAQHIDEKSTPGFWEKAYNRMTKEILKEVIPE
jgi:hypothetical protein